MSYNPGIGKEVDTTGPFDMQDAVVERYVLMDIRNGITSAEGGSVAFDFVDADGSGGSAARQLERRYLLGDRVDEVLAQEDVTEPLSAADRVLWRVTDHLGTTTVVNGVIIGTIRVPTAEIIWPPRSAGFPYEGPWGQKR